MLDSLTALPLGGSAIWDGPDGEPVRVSRDEDPDGPYFLVTAFEPDGEPGEARTFDTPDELLSWLSGGSPLPSQP